MTDALDRDPEGTVARARGIYLRALGRAPLDPRTERARVLSEAVSKEAERRRLARDAEETRRKWANLAAEKHGKAYELARNIWYGFPMTGAPELLYPELDNEAALTRGEWFEWTVLHKKAGSEALIDHLASIIPPREGETYPDWRERLKRRRRAWSAATDETVVNAHLYPQGNRWAEAAKRAGITRTPYVPPRPAGSPSPAKSRTDGAPKGRKRRPPRSPATPTESALR